MAATVRTTPTSEVTAAMGAMTEDKGDGVSAFCCQCGLSEFHRAIV